jgi:hypothetical protein
MVAFNVRTEKNRSLGTWFGETPAEAVEACARRYQIDGSKLTAVPHAPTPNPAATPSRWNLAMAAAIAAAT